MGFNYQKPKNGVIPDSNTPPKWKDYFNGDPRGPSTSELEAFEKAVEIYNESQKTKASQPEGEPVSNDSSLSFDPFSLSKVEHVTFENVASESFSLSGEQPPLKEGLVWLYRQNGVFGAVPFWTKNKETALNHVDNLVLEAQDKQQDTIVFLGRQVSLNDTYTIKDAICTVEAWFDSFGKDIFDIK